MAKSRQRAACLFFYFLILGIPLFNIKAGGSYYPVDMCTDQYSSFLKLLKAYITPAKPYSLVNRELDMSVKKDGSLNPTGGESFLGSGTAAFFEGNRLFPAYRRRR